MPNRTTSAGSDRYTTIIDSRVAEITDATTAAISILLPHAGMIVSTVASAPHGAVYIDPDEYKVDNTTLEYRLRATCLVNATAPARTMTVSLHAMTAVAGGADALTGTFGAAIAPSSVAFASPSLSTITTSVATFGPQPAGLYAIGMTLAAGTITADSEVAIIASLQARNI
jgi:hypothetical protein